MILLTAKLEFVFPGPLDVNEHHLTSAILNENVPLYIELPYYLIMDHDWSPEIKYPLKT